MSEIKYRIITKKPADKFSTPVDGAFGGVLPSGDISINFYTESIPMPTETIIIFDSERGKIINTEQSEDVSRTVLRETVSSISLTSTKAKEIYIWLGQLINQSEINRKEANDASNL